MAADPALCIRSMEQLAETVERYGFLPYFKNSIPGFSVEEHIAPEFWFGDVDGVWEWKGPLIRERRFAYGRFFEKKTAWMTMEWYLELANFRRAGYDMDALYEDGFAPAADRRLYELTAREAPVISRRLKAAGEYGGKGEPGCGPGSAALVTVSCCAVTVTMRDFIRGNIIPGYEIRL